MASKRQTGYKCRIAIVVLLLLASIAALVSVAVIQDSWASREYSNEVNAHTHIPQTEHINLSKMLFDHSAQRNVAVLHQ